MNRGRRRRTGANWLRRRSLMRSTSMACGASGAAPAAVSPPTAPSAATTAKSGSSTAWSLADRTARSRTCRARSASNRGPLYPRNRGHRGHRGRDRAKARFHAHVARLSCPRFPRRPGTRTGDTRSEGRVTVQDLLARLERVSKTHTGWTARCPAHEDARPSLSIGTAEDGRILLRCFAGCDLTAIVSALRIEVRDLFPDQSVSAARPGEPIPAPQVAAVA